jgi:hypothetical protein
VEQQHGKECNNCHKKAWKKKPLSTSLMLRFKKFKKVALRANVAEHSKEGCKGGTGGDWLSTRSIGKEIADLTEQSAYIYGSTERGS